MLSTLGADVGMVTDCGQTIATVSIPLPTLSQTQVDRLDAWLRSVLWEAEVPFQGEDYGTIDVHRLKGRVIREDGQSFLVQAVREVFEIFEEGRPAGVPSAFSGKLVLIGRGLRAEELKRSVEWYVVDGSAAA